MKKLLTQNFYRQAPLHLVPQLLGKMLQHQTTVGITSVIIVEVKVYLGPEYKIVHSLKVK